MRHGIFGSLIIVMVCCAIFVLIPLASAEDTLTRGSGFTVTITGKPNTAYYVWVARTFSMSGESGDQPPVIPGGQMNVVQDPSGGPYVIGLYQYNNGNGRTILDDVAPSSATYSNTRYYAQVTTDIDGVALVGFRTTSATADKKFSIVAQNPQSPGETVYVTLGLPERRVSIMAETTPPMVTPAPPLPLATTVPEATPVETPPQPVIPSPATPVPATTHPAPVDLVLVLPAIAGGLLVLRRSP
ncbi:MAG: hypothetical protein NTW33_06485 [Methanoregula sp.]|nr:hypothetical protein [Methanoregula sp.]